MKWRDEKMDEKGQGALEYLLLIAGAVLVAAIVIYLLSTVSGQGKESTHAGFENVNASLHSIGE